MTQENEEYSLGADVTTKARKGTARETAVISVRLTTSEVARLERLSQSTGLSISQIIRNAIAAFEVKETEVIMESWSGSRFEVGSFELGSFGFGNVVIENSNESVDLTGIVVEGLSA